MLFSSARREEERLEGVDEGHVDILSLEKRERKEEGKEGDVSSRPKGQQPPSLFSPNQSSPRPTYIMCAKGCCNHDALVLVLTRVGS